MDIIKDYDAILFDMDGTLIDSMGIWKDIDIEFLTSRNLPMHNELQREVEGKSFHETAVYFKERFNLTESLEEIKDIWNNMAFDKYTNNMPLKDGIIEFLQYLKKHNKKIAIATSNSRKLVDACLISLGIDTFFDAVVTACDVNKGKPAPDIYIEAAKRIGADNPQRCLVFEDVPMGILAGKNAGMRTCAVYDYYSKPLDDEKRELSDFYIEDYFELINNEFEV